MQWRWFVLAVGWFLYVWVICAFLKFVLSA